MPQAGTTTVADQSLIIHMKTTEPEELRNALITSLAATLRC